jgi:hypothetical protein
MTNGGQPAGWYADPSGRAQTRWWDGRQWTEHTNDPGAAAAPVAVAPPPPVAPAPWYGGAPGYGGAAGYGAAPGYGGAPAYGAAPTMPAPGGTSASLDGARSLLWVVLAGAAVVVLGSFLPWASVTVFGAELTVDGMDGDGPLTLIGGALVGALTLAAHLQRPARWKVVTALVLAALVTLIAVIDVVDVSSRVADVEGELAVDLEASVGIGLWLVLAGSVVATVGTALTLPRLRRG